MKHPMLLAALATCTFAGGCSYKSDTVVEKPVPAATTQRVTTVSSDPFVPATTSTTTVTTR